MQYDGPNLRLEKNLIDTKLKWKYGMTKNMHD